MRDTVSAALRKAARRIEKWRESAGGGPGSSIPDEIWDVAVMAAHQDGVGRTANVLRLNHRRLKQKVHLAANKGALVKKTRPRQNVPAYEASALKKPQFVELAIQSPTRARTVVELHSRCGDAMRISVEGAVDVAALSHVFWGQHG